MGQEVALKLSESDQELVKAIGIPVLPQPEADMYFGLIVHDDATPLEDSEVEKRLCIDMVGYYRTCAETYLVNFPEAGFTVEDLIKLCACDLRDKGLVRRWVDSATAKGPVEPPEEMIPAGKALYRVFAINQFQIEGEVVKMEEAQARSGYNFITEKEIESVFYALLAMKKEGNFKSVSHVSPIIHELLSIGKKRLERIVRKLVERGYIVNKGGDNPCNWQFLADKFVLGVTMVAPPVPAPVQKRRTGRSRSDHLVGKSDAELAKLCPEQDRTEAIQIVLRLKNGAQVQTGRMLKSAGIEDLDRRVPMTAFLREKGLLVKEGNNNLFHRVVLGNEIVAHLATEPVTVSARPEDGSDENTLLQLADLLEHRATELRELVQKIREGKEAAKKASQLAKSALKLL